MRQLQESPAPEATPDYLGAGKPGSEEDPRHTEEADGAE